MAGNCARQSFSATAGSGVQGLDSAVSTIRSSASGRGLGFRVVRELVAMSGGCLNVESQVDVGTSISAEWYAVKQTEAEMRQDEAKRIEAEVKTVLKGEAGWIAC